jgi:hypothetical protein
VSLPPPPPPLYKYLSVGAAEAVLKNASLRWSSPPLLNDPFDVQTALVLKVSDEEVISLALKYIADRLIRPRTAVNFIGTSLNLMSSKGIKFSEDQLDLEFRSSLTTSLTKLKGALPRFSAELIAGLSNSKYLCLSEAYDIPTMWSHYADAHCGIVLEFEAKNGVDSAFKCARPVKYVDEPPNFADAETLARVLAGDADFDLRTTIDKFVYCKVRDWSYEQEWRIDSASGRDPKAQFEDVPFFRTDLSSITFGLRTTDENKDRWFHLARKINISARIFGMRKRGLELERYCIT